MSSGAVFTKNGFNAMLNRMYKATPDYTVPSRFGIGTGSTTPTVNDTALETAITGWNGVSDYKDFVSGYPTFDTINQGITIQGFVSSTEANGNSISEFGHFNTDGTPNMDSRIVISTAITKTTAVQVYFTTTFRRT